MRQVINAILTVDITDIAYHNTLKGLILCLVINLQDLLKGVQAISTATLFLIVFKRASTSSWGIYIMNASGGDQREIIANADSGPDWVFGQMDIN